MFIELHYFDDCNKRRDKVLVNIDKIVKVSPYPKDHYHNNINGSIVYFSNVEFIEVKEDYEWIKINIMK